jgi:hypothetical protein
MISSKEHILYFFLSKRVIPLHYSDRRFFKNISKRIKDSNQITSGQSELFDKLISKYFNHLSSLQITLEDSLKLSWDCEVIETSPFYCSARIYLEDNNIIIKCPMNTKFINYWTRIEDNSYIWNPTINGYKTEFSTVSLKLAMDVLPKFFSSVEPSVEINQLLTKTFTEKLIWDPTLRKINNNYIIYASNNTLDLLMQPIDETHLDKSLYEISKLGIKIDDSIIDNQAYLKFCSEFVTEVDVIHMYEFVNWIKKLDIKHVLLGRGISNYTKISSVNLIFTELLRLFDKNNIRYTLVKSVNQLEIKEPSILIQYHGDDKLKYYGRRAITKCVYIRNSLPIDLDK